ncbi:MAG: hypothetical protein EXQ63_03960 [Ilumatobacteraceae bacterium]|nr:hypothetical protein [Ilumatobacteraceae bacterium]
MGQPVAVEEKTSTSGRMVRFETNRSLTGQGHENFATLESCKGTRPSAVISRRFLESGQVISVHVFSNIVTAQLAPGATQAGLTDIVRDLYQYWKPGMEPPSIESLMAQVEAPTIEATSTVAADGEVLDPRVPSHLFQRSKDARARLTGS